MSSIAPQNFSLHDTYEDLGNDNNNNNNISHCSLSGYNPFTTPICATLDILVGLAGFSGNLLVILSVIKFKALRTSTNTYIVSLAISDLLVCLNIPYYITFYFDIWYRCNKYACIIRYVTIEYATIVSVLSLVGVAVDRYLAIVHALKYRSLMCGNWVWISICGIYVYVGVVIIPIVWFNTWSTDVLECDLAYIISKGYALYGVVFNVLVTIIVTMVLYSQVFKIAWSQVRRLTSEDNKVFLESRTALTMVLVIGVHLVSLTPYLAVILARYYDDYDQALLSDAKRLATTLYFSKSCINPLIYGWKNKDFHDAFKKLLLTEKNLLNSTKPVCTV